MGISASSNNYHTHITLTPLNANANNISLNDLSTIAKRRFHTVRRIVPGQLFAFNNRKRNYLFKVTTIKPLEHNCLYNFARKHVVFHIKRYHIQCTQRNALDTIQKIYVLPSHATIAPNLVNNGSTASSDELYHNYLSKFMRQYGRSIHFTKGQCLQMDNDVQFYVVDVEPSCGGVISENTQFFCKGNPLKTCSRICLAPSTKSTTLYPNVPNEARKACLLNFLQANSPLCLGIGSVLTVEMQLHSSINQDISLSQPNSTHMDELYRKKLVLSRSNGKEKVQEKDCYLWEETIAKPKIDTWSSRETISMHCKSYPVETGHYSHPRTFTQKCTTMADESSTNSHGKNTMQHVEQGNQFDDVSIRFSTKLSNRDCSTLNAKHIPPTPYCVYEWIVQDIDPLYDTSMVILDNNTKIHVADVPNTISEVIQQRNVMLNQQLETILYTRQISSKCRNCETLSFPPLGFDGLTYRCPCGKILVNPHCYIWNIMWSSPGDASAAMVRVVTFLGFLKDCIECRPNNDPLVRMILVLVLSFPRNQDGSLDYLWIDAQLHSSQGQQGLDIHILENFPIVQFNETSLQIHQNANQPKCSICLTEYVIGDFVRTLPCFHRFHVDCVDRWLEKSTQCPICKHRLQ